MKKAKHNQASKEFLSSGKKTKSSPDHSKDDKKRKTSKSLKKTFTTFSKRETISVTKNKGLQDLEIQTPLASTQSSPPRSIQGVYISEFDHLGELPEAYGTGRLFFVARDPGWIYSYWDYSKQQIEEMRGLARHGELKLKVYKGNGTYAPLHQEITLNQNARNWCINVGISDADYCAEFGYYDWNGCFVVKSRSGVTHTPADRLSEKTETRFVTIPFRVPFSELFAIVRAYFNDGEELADVLCRLQADGFRFPFDYKSIHEIDSGDRDKLMTLFGGDLLHRVRMGSEEISEWIRRRLHEQLTSGLFSVSSPFGASFCVAPQPRNFWFNVNAELIIYGMTERNAKVVFDGKKIPLNSDGTFRFHFALPDGNYGIPISATSADEIETRAVDLQFSRNTSRKGDVGIVPASEDLQPLLHE